MSDDAGPAGCLWGLLFWGVVVGLSFLAWIGLMHAFGVDMRSPDDQFRDRCLKAGGVQVYDPPGYRAGSLCLDKDGRVVPVE